MSAGIITTFYFLYCIYEPPTRPSPLASRSACYCSGRTGSDVEQRCSMLSPMSLFQNTVHRTLCLVLGCLALLFLILFNPFILNYDIFFFGWGCERTLEHNERGSHPCATPILPPHTVTYQTAVTRVNLCRIRHPTLQQRRPYPRQWPAETMMWVTNNMDGIL